MNINFYNKIDLFEYKFIDYSNINFNSNINEIKSNSNYLYELLYSIQNTTYLQELNVSNLNFIKENYNIVINNILIKLNKRNQIMNEENLRKNYNNENIDNILNSIYLSNNNSFIIILNNPYFNNNFDKLNSKDFELFNTLQKKFSLSNFLIIEYNPINNRFPKEFEIIYQNNSINYNLFFFNENNEKIYLLPIFIVSK
jgi:hypothetical protein